MIKGSLGLIIFMLILRGILFSIFLDYPGINFEAPLPEAHKITWEFHAYQEPNFESEPIERHQPQTVTIIHRIENSGWALVEIDGIGYYVYLDGNYFFISGVKGLYENYKDKKAVDYIKSLLVEVVEWKDDWLLIKMDEELFWVNMNFSPPKDELSKFFSRFGGGMAIYYENLRTGYVYRHNAERTFFSASVPKAWYSFYLYQEAEKGLLDLNSEHTYRPSDLSNGSEMLHRRHRFGSKITVKELIGYNLRYSDNAAANMLRRINGLNGYRNFVKEIGGTPRFIRNNIFDSFLNANEAGLFARKIYEYIESDSAYGYLFKDHLLNNKFPFIVSDYPIASKTGWTKGSAWHDMAIVYAPSPYILVILSQRNGTQNDHRVFRDISKVIQDFNDKWFQS